MAPAAPSPPDVRRYPGSAPGLLLAFARDLLDGVGRLDAVGGDLVVAGAGRLPGIVLARHPDLVREILVDRNEDLVKARGLRLAQRILGQGLLTSEPPVHTKQRKLMLPGFHHGRLRHYGETMVRLTEREAAGWRDGVAFDGTEAMSRLALAIAGETLFGADVLSDAGRVTDAVHDAMYAFDGAQYPFADKLTWLPTRSNRMSGGAREVLDEVVYGMIEQRRAAAGDHDDLLAMLLDARDAETGAAMTDEEVRDEATTLLLAGHETTAVALGWTWALLAEHPEAEARLWDEVDALGRAPGFDDLAALPYARAVFAEALRLYPPAWVVGRQAARDTTLGGKSVRRGTTVLFMPLGLHRDARFWDDPEAFRPERFVGPTGHPKFAYVPFSAGRRGCIGEQFAWVEGTLLIAAIARQWRLRIEGGVPATHGSVTLRPARPVRLVPTARG